LYVAGAELQRAFGHATMHM